MNFSSEDTAWMIGKILEYSQRTDVMKQRLSLKGARKQFKLKHGISNNQFRSRHWQTLFRLEYPEAFE